MLIGGGLALWVRYLLRDFQNDDYRYFTGPWVAFIRAHAGYRALAFPFSNYTPPYLYLLVLFNYLFPKLSSLYLIKLISVVFDFLAALLIYRLIRIKYPQGIGPALASLAFLFLPTIFINSAFWGQADIIYTVPLLACVYFFLKDRPTLGMIAFGVAISIKLQAIFLAPWLVMLLVNKKTTLASFILIPITYFVLILPAWIIGRPLPDLLTIYLAQGDTYRELTMNAPNLYTWLPNSLYDLLVPAGLLLTILLALSLIAVAYRNQATTTPKILLALATLSVIAMPFFLPKMHDRYFYPADVLSLALGFYFSELFFIPLLVQFVSLFAYFPFLFRTEPVPLELLAVFQLLGILALTRSLFNQWRQVSDKTEVEAAHA
ncbi:MAG: DUF2029 domain-containing protein [Anaerolineales bacterium]|nr:DUF2029 domain-containing protein [Anaerolineales bacterium]